ncbi:hypothetical protein D3C73_1522130 [compost metagenome]
MALGGLAGVQGARKTLTPPLPQSLQLGRSPGQVLGRASRIGGPGPPLFEQTQSVRPRQVLRIQVLELALQPADRSRQTTRCPGELGHVLQGLAVLG